MTTPRRHRRRPVKDNHVVTPRHVGGRFTAGLNPVVASSPLGSGASVQEVRDRQCGTHVRYPSQMTAVNAATALNWSGRVVGDPVEAYECPWCTTPGDAGWHVGQSHA